MNETEKLTRAVRGLMVAVWFLCGLTAALVFALWGWFRPQTFSSFEAQVPVSSADGMSSSQMKVDNDFSAYPPEEKVRRASMILVIEYRRDGDRMKAVITEIVKKKPDARFYYSVGDEFGELSHMADDPSHGEGQVVFLTGNPPRMNVSYSYEKGRIGGLGQMPIAALRDLAKASS